MYSRFKMSKSYEQLYSGKSNGVIPVMKYKSKNSGMTVVIAQVDGPLVNGYFCLATEAHDDDGLPHTLEHIIFMGSEEYPYKGVLDLLANRCLASGTNAWTDTDHTCYTMTTAGSEGFLNLLPIYLDHVLYPTIEESHYITEVHHINGEGDNAGVVYCEMQARENTGESRTHLAMLRAMYPGHCGYKSETGGMLENLRTSTSHKKVLDYHRQYYCPDNLCLIITGQVSPDDVFKALEPIEKKIVGKGARDPYTRPWQSPVPPLEESVHQVVRYPSDDEDNGMVFVAWRGSLAKHQEEMSALMILMEYLTDTVVAPLQRDFVEIDDPYCSRVYYSIIENSESCLYIGFKNVPMAKLPQVLPKLTELLSNIGEKKEEIDMTRMANVVHRRKLEVMSNLEDQPHDTMAFSIIGDFLYGNTNEELETRLNQIAVFERLGTKPQDFWVELLNKYLIGTKSVTIVGEPSKALMEEMGSTEKERVKKQAETLGEKGLKEKADILEKATEENEREPPEAMLTSVDVPDVGCIRFHPIQPSSNHDSSAANSNDAFPLADIPVPFQLDDIQTNFATMVVMMDTNVVPDELRPYLSLCMEVLLESPVLRDGKLIPYEDIIKELEADTLDNGAALGIGGSKFSCGRFSQVAALELKVEREKYERGVSWLREILFQTQFTEERLKIVANKMINDVAQSKRSGRSVVRTLLKEMLFNKTSNHHMVSMLRQHKFLSDMVQELEKPEGVTKVIENMNKLRDLLVQPSNLRVHLATNSKSLTSPQAPWLQDMLPKDAKMDGEKPTIKADSALLQAPAEGESTGMIVGVGAVESSFLMQTTPCISSYKHEDLAAIMVYLQYLTQLEGPMWRQIRGLGLSYHYSMFVKPDEGLLYFLLYKSTHVVSAYKQAKEIVDGYLTKKTLFSPVEFETCKSSLIFEIIEEEKTPSDASSQSLLSYFRGVDNDFNRHIIQSIPKVTLDDLERVGQQYIAPCFDPQRSKVAICCHPTKVAEVTNGFKELSRELKVIENMDESFMAEM